MVLDHITTPNLIHLEVASQANKRRHGEEEILANFLGRIKKDSLKSLTLRSHPNGEWLTIEPLSSLSLLPSVTQLTLDGCPFDGETILLPKGMTLNEWCPKLQELVFITACPAAEQFHQMRALANFLKRPKAIGVAELEGLTIARHDRDVEFPYALCEDVLLGRLRVMLPCLRMMNPSPLHM
jgi:hypothetical protein